MTHEQLREALRDLEYINLEMHEQATRPMHTPSAVSVFKWSERLRNTREALAALDREGAGLRGITDGSPDCECHRCIREHGKGVETGDLTLELVSSAKMILCGVCGNKRCPQATDHRLACTNSNESGQEGSVYGVPLRSFATPPPPRDEGREWQPIETAPKDEYVLVSCGPGGMIEACQPTEFVGKQYPWIDSYGNPVVGPEHWMPLPVPPRALAGG